VHLVGTFEELNSIKVNKVIN